MLPRPSKNVRRALRDVGRTPGGVASLVWILVVGTALFSSVTAAATSNDIVTDTPNVDMEVGTTIQVGYMVLSATLADGSLSCNASPGTPTLLTFAAPPGVGVGPTPLAIAQCDQWVFASVSASAPVTGQILVTASDGAGHTYNTFRAGSSIFVHAKGDSTAPVISVPAQYVAEATSPSGARVAVSATASDPDDTVASVSCSPKPLVYPLGVTNVTCTAKDSNGNVGLAYTKVIVVDTTPPSFAAPSDVTLIPQGPAIVNYTTPTASDIVDLSDPVLCAPPSGSAFPAGTTTVTCTSTDAHNNTATRTFRVTIIDQVPPSATAGSMTVEATSPAGATVSSFTGLLVWDFIDPNPTVACLPPAGSTFPIAATTEGVTRVGCVATDHSNNTASASFDVHVVDTTPPALRLPAPTLEASDGSGARVAFVASATDAVDVTDPVACAPASGSLFPVGATTVACSATDLHGNAASGSFVVTVTDTRAPVVLAPADLVVEATGPSGAPASFDVAASDGVDGAVPVVCTPSSGAAFPIAPTTPGVTRVDCSATDQHGNTGRASFNVTVVDTRPPSLHLPSSLVVPAVGGSASPAWFASALDVVDGDVPVACSPASGSTLPPGVTRVTCTARDAHRNLAAASFDVNVVEVLPPQIAVPDPLVVEATGPSGAAVAWSASATDPQDGPLPVSCTAQGGATYPLGLTVVTCTATNSFGASASASFSITVVDTTPPVLALPASVSAYAFDPAGARVTFPASATDLVDGTDAVRCDPGSGSVFAPGDTTVTCSSVDAHGNEATRAFVVHVTLSTPPTLALPPDATLEATSPAGAAATWTATASDALDGALPVTCTATSGATYPLGPTVVSCSATNGRGQTASGSFAITVVDTTPPVLHLPSPIAVYALGASTATVGYSTSATDIVDVVDAVSCSPASGSAFPVGTTLVRCASTDAHGNAASASFTVTVTRSDPPVLTLPPPQVLEAAGPNGVATLFAASAFDALDGALAVTCTPASGSTFPLGITTVVCSATNARGQTASGSFTITVRDTTPPVIVAPSLVLATASGAGNATVYWTTSASDVVDVSDPVVCSPASGSAFPVGNTTVTCTSTDAHGNAASVTFVVRVAPPPLVCRVTDYRPPINTPGHTKSGENEFRDGSTIPVKIRVDCGKDKLPQTPRFYYARILADGSLGPETPGRSSASVVPDNAFRPAGIQWLFNWDTKGLPATEYRIRVDVGDGASHVLLPFRLT